MPLTTEDYERKLIALHQLIERERTAHPHALSLLATHDHQLARELTQRATKAQQRPR